MVDRRQPGFAGLLFFGHDALHQIFPSGLTVHPQDMFGNIFMLRIGLGDAHPWSPEIVNGADAAWVSHLNHQRQAVVEIDEAAVRIHPRLTAFQAIPPSPY